MTQTAQLAVLCATSATPISGAVSLQGGVADDIPGTAIGSGAVVTSVVDRVSKVSDVYAVCLAAGQTFNVDLKSGGEVHVWLAYPGSRSFQANQLKTNVEFCPYGTECHQATTVPSGGIYYLQVTARYGRSQYELSLSVK